MTNKDIKHAFSHPSERAEATAENALRDRISLRDHIVDVEIGAFQAERGTTQRLKFNIVVEVRPYSDPLDDDVDRILSYDTIAEAIATELSDERLNLLETLAERVAERILHEPRAMRVFVRIEKLDRGPGALGVEIVRTRKDISDGTLEPPEAESLQQPVVVYLSNEALGSDNLSGWIDALVASDAPGVLCVGASDSLAPQSSSSASQRRIDMLAIEQNAWVLAGRDGRCVVVNTRTELDWAMKHQQISVWAPSKMILDAVDGPSVSPRDAKALAVWLAGLLHASELIVVDESKPLNAPVPARQVALTDRTLF
ncbi:dihydroneopterin aldolase [Pseudohalocynthiibacter aestuariivivens]|jgi:7,8-dihydroneopterin aldolase/epimerase/oxygenase|uniref:dihydroneopterin aldolase n=1 Tax=Pseudohalocynthiibacter aestuariivivens TaxID=1591409 RepID=A0ABV5JE55_9RHOB|nr:MULTISPECIES: dihydroneopterin aldolase [Pseudohalocynthiibacter]MBS9718876.1 dihydroneopterin aldolase [Pseudohalocynthiibacter aestuariivivens]MCK0101853.1 dihydroneopterin aldolase [Pseudohalocynthiibacter sp. F2068]